MPIMKTYTVTQIADAAKNAPEEIQKARELAYRLGELRGDLWNKFGGVQAWGVKADGLIRDFKLTNPPENYLLDFKNWDKTASQVLDDIQMTHAAIREQVMRLIYARYPEQAERSALCKALKTLAYQENNVLHRWVRDASGRGHTEVDNHIVLCHNNGAKFNRKNRITEVVFNGLPVEGKNNRYEKITLKFKTGKVNLVGYATIIFHEDGVIRLHYPVKKEAIVNASHEIIGVDKGYTEALYGSDKQVYGAGIGKIISQQSDWLKAKMQHRHKLHALYKKTGNEAIRKNNLGRKTLDKQVKAIQAQLKSIIRRDVRVIFSKFGTVVCEDLSAKFKGKSRGKNTNRKLSAWCKGEIHQALTEIADRTGSTIKIVNPAYTSQVDHLTGTLLGTRKGDCFIRYTGDVVQADYNAAMNILARDNDKDINRYMPYQKVKQILLKRTACFTEKMKLGGGVPIEGLA
jgi:IS605 OrfB family transposase